jgi:hypothetical protein
MKSFSDYVKFRESDEFMNDEPINPSEDNSESILSELIKLAWSKHQPQVEKLFNKLSEIDPDIAVKYKKINKTSSFPQKQQQNNQDVEIIRPPVADTGGDLNNSND